MKLNRTKNRWLLCGLIVIAFFAPAYNGLSAAGFIASAFSEAETHRDITKADILIAIIPLLMVPLSAAGIFVRSYFMRRSVATVYLLLPLLFTLAFLCLLFFTGGEGSHSFSNAKVLMEMQVGFYIHMLACCLLVFTKKIHRRRTGIPSPTPEPLTA